MRLHTEPLDRIQQAEKMATVLSWTASDSLSRPCRTESVQKVLPVAHPYRHLPYAALARCLGLGGCPIVRVAAQPGDSL